METVRTIAFWTVLAVVGLFGLLHLDRAVARSRRREQLRRFERSVEVKFDGFTQERVRVQGTATLFYHGVEDSVPTTSRAVAEAANALVTTIAQHELTALEKDRELVQSAALKQYASIGWRFTPTRLLISTFTVSRPS